jgi:hypothetical protein
MSGTVKALVSADQPLIRIYGGDGEYAEIQFETQNDANAAVERFNEVLKKATGIVFTKGPASSPRSRTVLRRPFSFARPSESRFKHHLIKGET